jgi:hypothetical protein
MRHRPRPASFHRQLRLAAAAIIGTGSAAVAAAKPAESYVADLNRKAHYEQLYWELYTFAVTNLPQVDKDEFRAE